MADPISLKRRLERKLPRALKAGRQWMRAAAAGGRPQTRLVFVVGSQRSGTRLPMQVMDCSPDIATFTEGTEPYFNGVLLEPLHRIEKLVSRSPAPVIALKPICETHRINELLDKFSGSKAIWIFRNYQDAVKSASVKWSSGRKAVRRLAFGDLIGAGWRSGGLTHEKLELVKRLYREDMSLHDANAVMWYLRNGLFFELHAYARPDVLLVRYEDLVGDPTVQFGRVFSFIGTPLPARLADAIHSSTRSRRLTPEIAPEIRTLCGELHERLLVHYQNQVCRNPLLGVAPAASRALATR